MSGEKSSPSSSQIELFTGIVREDRQKWEQAVIDTLSETDKVLYFVPTKLKKRSLETTLLWDSRPVYQGERVWTLQQFLEDKGKEVWFAHGSDRQLLSKLSKQLFLEEIIARCQEEGRPMLPGLARRFALLAEEIKEFMVADLQRPISAFLEELNPPEDDFRRQVLLGYEEFLKEKDSLDERDLLLLLAETISQNPSVLEGLIGDVKTLLIDGFYFFTPIEEYFLTQIMAIVGETKVYVPISEKALSSNDEAFALPRRTLQFFLSLPEKGDFEIQRFPESEKNLHSFSRLFGEEEKVETPPADIEVSLVEAETRLAEVEAMAGKVKELIHRGVRPSEILVTFPQFHTYLPLVEEIFPLFDIHFVTTLGPTMDQVPLIQSLLRLLELPLRGFERQEVLDVLSSEYIQWVCPGEGDTEIVLDHFEVEKITQIARITGGGQKEWKKRLKEGEKWLAQREEEGRHLPMDLETYSRQARALVDFLDSLPLWHKTWDVDDLQAKIESLVEDLRLSERIVDLAGLHHSRKILTEKPQLIRRDFECLEKWEKNLREVLGTLKDLDRSEIKGSDFIRLWKDVLRSIDLQGEFPDSLHVPILGLLDTRGLSFSHVLMGGFLEGEFPKYPEYDILLRLEERKKMDWPSPSLRSLAEEKLIFILLLQSTEKTFTFFTPKNQGGVPQLPSPFLQNVKEIIPLSTREFRSPAFGTEKIAPHITSQLYREIRLGRDIGGGKKTVTQIRKTLEQAPGSSRYLRSLLQGIRAVSFRDDLRQLSRYEGLIEKESFQREIRNTFDLFSITQLETYAKCPFRFFHERVLRLEDYREVEGEITAQEQGDLIHDILFHFYQDWKKENPTGEIGNHQREEASRLLLETARSSFNKAAYAFLQGPLWEKYKEQLVGGLEEEEGTGILKEFLENEIASDTLPSFFEWRFGEFSSSIEDDEVDSHSVEKNFLLESREDLPVVIPYDQAVTIPIRGKIDRIDFLSGEEEGEGIPFEVCDYKTGSNPRRGDIKKGKSFQLPIYLLAVRQLLGGKEVEYLPTQGAYYKLKEPHNIKKTYVIKTGNLNRDLEMAQSHMIEDMKALEKGYFNTTTDFKGLDSYGGFCNHCPAQKVCTPPISFTLGIRHRDHAQVIHRKEILLKNWEE